MSSQSWVFMTKNSLQEEIVYGLKYRDRRQNRNFEPLETEDKIHVLETLGFFLSLNFR